MRVWYGAQLIARRLLLKVGVTMPLITSAHETSCLLGLKRKSGSIRSHAVSRLYPGRCPFDIGQKISIATEVRGKLSAFAGCVLRGIAEMSFSFRSDKTEAADSLAKGEGFSSAQAWAIAFRTAFPHVQPSSTVTRLQFDEMRFLTEAQPNAPRQPDQPQEPDASRSLGSIADLDDIGA